MISTEGTNGRGSVLSIFSSLLTVGEVNESMKPLILKFVPLTDCGMVGQKGLGNKRWSEHGSLPGCFMAGFRCNEHATEPSFEQKHQPPYFSNKF